MTTTISIKSAAINENISPEVMNILNSAVEQTLTKPFKIISVTEIKEVYSTYQGWNHYARYAQLNSKN